MDITSIVINSTLLGLVALIVGFLFKKIWNGIMQLQMDVNDFKVSISTANLKIRSNSENIISIKNDLKHVDSGLSKLDDKIDKVAFKSLEANNKVRDRIFKIEIEHENNHPKNAKLT